MGKKLYLAHWPNEVTLLVQARNERELVAILSEYGEPESASWMRYDGPVVVGFSMEYREGKSALSVLSARGFGNIPSATMMEAIIGSLAYPNAKGHAKMTPQARQEEIEARPNPAQPSLLWTTLEAEGLQFTETGALEEIGAEFDLEEGEGEGEGEDEEGGEEE